MSTTVKKVHGLLAEFGGPKELFHAAEKMRDAGFKNWDVYTPYPVHGMDAAMGLGRSRLPWFVFFGGLTGLIAGFLLPSLTQTELGAWGPIGWLLEWLPGGAPYPTIVQAKPTDITTTPAFFPVMFELTILCSALTTLGGVLALMGLPRLHHPLFDSENFAKATDDGFLLCVEKKDPRFDEEETQSFLEEIGGTNVELVKTDA